MIKSIGPERFSNPDFLSENTRVSFEISSDAAHSLPEVTEIDLKTKNEKYAYFLGDYEVIDSNHVQVNIRTVVELTEQEEFYTEGKMGVCPNLRAIKQLEEGMGNLLVGDIHTHPVLAEEMEAGMHPASPSTDDAKDIILDYEAGVLRPDQPFIFAISFLDKNKKPAYGFYRLVKEGNKYKVVQMERE